LDHPEKVNDYDEIFEIEDKSTNGTFLNGTKLIKNEPVRIKDGDKIGLVVVSQSTNENGKER
jgi:pSer/pThr/pTyr-binding forkhead associated (FHA) protein